jgi:hypothetical protein
MTIRPRISQEEYNWLLEKRQEHTALLKECEEKGIPFDEVRHYWHKGKNFSLFVKPEGKDIEQVLKGLVEEIKTYAPKYPTIEYPDLTDGHLLVIDPADVHLGKLCSAFETGEEYNANIAMDRVRRGVHGIVHKCHGFNIEKILLIIGNDILHVDTPKSTTTSGTFQDTHLMWYDAFTMAKGMYVEIIETLMQIAPVHVQYNPSNHDYTNGFFLADTLNSWFAKCEQVTFSVSTAHRKYYQYHGNLIGTTHGDGAKEQDLPLLMAHEAKEQWAKTDHKYFYVHHIHHKKSKDYMGVCVESLRSPSGTDSWHHRNGYQHSPKAIEGYVHHPNHGQIARITHLF